MQQKKLIARLLSCKQQFAGLVKPALCTKAGPGSQEAHVHPWRGPVSRQALQGSKKLPDVVSSVPKQSWGFQKGVSGNPAGRPKGASNLATKLLDAAGTAAAQGILAQVVERANSGDMVAASIVLNRIWPVRRGARFRLDLGDTGSLPGCIRAQTQVINAMSDGIISATEAAEYSAVISSQTRLIETSEVIARLEALEAK